MSARSIRRAQARRLAAEQRRAALRARKLGLVAGATALGIAAPSAQANTYTVTTTADSGGGSLRAAIASANANPGDDTITFSGAGASGTIRLTTGAIAITPADNSGGTTITGPGAGTLTISGDANSSGTPNAGDSQIFKITGVASGNQPGGSVTISGLTLTNGYDGAGGAGGGAVLDDDRSTLTMTDVAITNSKTDASSGNGGGAIQSNGVVLLTRATLTGNTSARNGGAVTVEGTTTALSKYASLLVTDSTVSGNTAASSGGGILQVGGQLIVSNSHLTGNTATGPTSIGGGLAAAGKYRTIVKGSTITGNSAHAGGGLALIPYVGADTELQNSTVSGNQGVDGAGLYITEVLRSSKLIVDHSTISANQGGASSFGGGIAIGGGTAGTIDILESTLSGNTATNGAGLSIGTASSGPVFEHYNSAPQGTIRVDNSTIASNAATTHGGGIYLSSYDYGSPSAKHAATITVSSTIVSGNTAAGAGQDADRADNATDGGINSAFSLFQAPGDAPLASTATITGADPLLGALGDNGGTTQTMKPAGTSPVLDQGHSPTTAPQSGQTDQLGQARTVDTGLANPAGGDGTDMGAVELDAASVVVPVTPPPPTPAFTVSVRGTSIAGAAIPLLPAGASTADCAITIGQLNSCVIEIRSTAAMTTRAKTIPAGALLASGEVTSAGAASLSAPVTLTSAGRAVLAGRPLGLDGAATAVGAAASPHTVTGKVHLLKGTSITLPLATRSATLAPSVQSQLDQVAVMLNATKTVTCTAYSDKHGSARADKRLTATQAKAACRRLVAKGVHAKITTVGAGHSHAIASNKTAKGRAANRRLVISFTF